MWEKLVTVLACPDCHGDLHCRINEIGVDGDIFSGSLRCDSCENEFPIVRGIPRFVPENNYAHSFGFQWNRFRAEQIDAENQTRFSENRFRSETDWMPESLSGQWVLDVGCGAGRFLEVASRSSTEVVGLDLSNAVNAARITVAGRRNVHLVQASLYSPPFRLGAFDACYCIGVLQHTQDPLQAVASLPPILHPSGRLALTIYERHPGLSSMASTCTGI